MEFTQEQQQEEDPPLLTLSHVDSNLDLFQLEDLLTSTLNLTCQNISVMDVSDGQVMFTLYPEDEDEDEIKDNDKKQHRTISTILTGPQVVNIMNQYIQTNTATWLNSSKSRCSIAQEEEEIYIDEEEALRLWREASDRTSHLATVSSPDGIQIQPTHHNMEEMTKANEGDDNEWISPTHAQLKRDPTLLNYDNVKRIDITQLDTISWQEPIIITGLNIADSNKDNDNNNDNDNTTPENILTKSNLIQQFGTVEVRTGNRNTFIDNGFNNSEPMLLSQAIESVTGTECSTMIFSPIKELPLNFGNFLKPFTEYIPCDPNMLGFHEQTKKYTLCLANEGFGIGFHRHNAAMFMLLAGKKKWYMGPKETEKNLPTHPEFYTSKSSHKCIQQVGECLYVPNEWYHEIFNLEFTAGIQALPE